MLEDWYFEHVAKDAIHLRNQVLSLLQEESKLLDIVQLVGEDVLPDSQRLVLEISRMIKTGILQQNAFHDEDSFVPMTKQYKMLYTVWHLYQRSILCAEKGIPMSLIKDDALFEKITKMKYTIPNGDLSGIDTINGDIDAYYDALVEKYN